MERANGDADPTPLPASRSGEAPDERGLSRWAAEPYRGRRAAPHGRRRCRRLEPEAPLPLTARRDPQASPRRSVTGRSPDAVHTPATARGPGDLRRSSSNPSPPATSASTPTTTTPRSTTTARPAAASRSTSSSKTAHGNWIGIEVKLGRRAQHRRRRRIPPQTRRRPRRQAAHKPSSSSPEASTPTGATDGVYVVPLGCLGP